MCVCVSIDGLILKGGVHNWVRLRRSSFRTRSPSVCPASAARSRTSLCIGGGPTEHGTAGGADKQDSPAFHRRRLSFPFCPDGIFRGGRARECPKFIICIELSSRRDSGLFFTISARGRPARQPGLSSIPFSRRKWEAISQSSVSRTLSLSFPLALSPSSSTVHLAVEKGGGASDERHFE